MIPRKHPRFVSLTTREQLVAGVEDGMTSLNGLIAQGRGEAFDYLLGEKTAAFAVTASKIAAQLLCTASHPVLSINGNIAALCALEYVQLAAALKCPIEINLFHSNHKRKKAIAKKLTSLKFTNILGIDDATIALDGISSERRWVSPNGIAKADVVLVPLEDGDRCEALIKAGKKVVTIDLNPLSRTAQMATVTIVDNVIRALPLLTTQAKDYTKNSRLTTKGILKTYNNKKVLSEALRYINRRLKVLSK